MARLQSQLAVLCALVALLGASSAAAVCSADAQCMNAGKCNVPAGVCACATAAFVGPTCAVPVSPANALAFGTTLKFSFQIDPVDATMIHFRMDGATLDWISVMISAGDYNTGDSMTAYTNAAGTWVLEDQTGHPNSPAMSDVGNNGRDDLLNKLVWLPTPTSVAATWSRKLSTGDTVADKIITNAAVQMGWAVGRPGISFAMSSTHNGIGKYVQVNLANAGGAAPVTVPPTAAPTAGPTAAPLNGCTTDAQCMNGGACDTAAAACKCSGPGFLGPTCAVKSTNLFAFTPAFSLAFQLDPTDLTLMHFRMDGKTADWLSVMIVPPAPADYNAGDSATAYKNAAGAWVLEDQTTHPNGPDMADTLPTLHGRDDLLKKVVWTNGGGVSAAWSRKLNTGDPAADQIIPQGSAKIAWAIGKPGVSFGASSTHDGIGEYVNINLLTGAANAAVPFNMNAPMLAFGLIFALVIGALTIIHTSVSVARLGAVRWLMNARFVCWPKANPMWNTLTFDILPFFRMATVGELLVLVAYFIALIAFSVIGFAEYARTQRDVRYILGYLTSLHLALVMLPVNRNSPFLYLCGVPFERALNWHRVMGRATMVFLVGHAIHSVVAYKGKLALLLTNKTGTNENLFPASGNLDGVISGIVFAVLIALSWGPIRRQFFEVFYYVHQLFIVGLYFGFAHSKWAFYLGITTVLIHAVDRAIRVYRGTLPCEVRAVRTLPAGQDRILVELRLHAPHIARKMEAGSYVFLNVPAASATPWDWHPYSISSAPYNDRDEFTLHVLAYVPNTESFSTRLAALAADNDPDVFLHADIRVDGPYGELAVAHWRTDYAHLVMCGGGSGVTPMMSMLGELLHMRANKQMAHVQSVHLIWVSSNLDPIRDWFPAQLRALREMGAPFELHLHDTGTRKTAAHSAPLPFRGKPVPARIGMGSPNRSGGNGNGGRRAQGDAYQQLSDSAAAPGDGVGGAIYTPVDEISRLPITVGRPDYEQYFSQIEGWRRKGDLVGVFSCGPAPMIESVRNAGALFGFACHEESFEY